MKQPTPPPSPPPSPPLSPPLSPSLLPPESQILKNALIKSTTTFFDIRKSKSILKKEKIFEAKLSLLGKNPIEELPDIIQPRTPAPVILDQVEQVKRVSPPPPPVEVKNKTKKQHFISFILEIYKVKPEPPKVIKDGNCGDCGEKMQNEALHSIFCQKKGKHISLKSKMECLAELIGNDLEKPISKNNPDLIENGRKLRDILL